MARDEEERSTRKWAQGRALAEFYDKDGKLLPAEAKLLEACRVGGAAIIGDELQEEKTDQNIIRPGFLRFLALGGDRDAPVHEAGVRVQGAWIDGDLELSSSFIDVRLVLLRCRISGYLTLYESEARGINLSGSVVGGVIADGLICHGSLLLRDKFLSTSEVRLPNARIRTILSCTGSKFEGTGGDALNCDGIEIDGNIYFDRDFHATGSVRLVGAQIGGDLVCSAGRFDGAGTDALICDRVRVGGTLFLNNGFRATGTVRFLGASIKGNAALTGGSFGSSSNRMLLFDGADVAGSLFFRSITKTEDSEWSLISLAGCHASDLVDDETSWYRLPVLILDGFRYDRLSGDTPGNAESRIRWLDRQWPTHLTQDFRPQPWQQLAGVFQEMGHEEDAKQVRIEMRKRWRQSRWKFRKRWWERAWWWILTRPDASIGFTVGYGYRPMRAVWGLVLIWLIGSFVYWGVIDKGVFAPSDSRVYLDSSIPTECKADWVTFTGPRLPEPRQILRSQNPRERERFANQIDQDWKSRVSAANRAGLDALYEWHWKDICPSLMPSEYSVFQPSVYSLDVTLPLLNLYMESEWAPRVLDAEGNVLWPIGSLPSWLPFVGGTWGLGYFVRMWEWFAIFMGWVLALLIAASISGIIKKE
jgi:hypothetical protein